MKHRLFAIAVVLLSTASWVSAANPPSVDAATAFARPNEGSCNASRRSASLILVFVTGCQ